MVGETSGGAGGDNLPEAGPMDDPRDRTRRPPNCGSIYAYTPLYNETVRATKSNGGGARHLADMDKAIMQTGSRVQVLCV